MPSPKTYPATRVAVLDCYEDGQHEEIHHRCEELFQALVQDVYKRQALCLCCRCSRVFRKRPQGVTPDALHSEARRGRSVRVTGAPA